jgi:hypothetical protein
MTLCELQYILLRIKVTKTGNARQLLLKVSCTELQQYLQNYSSNTLQDQMITVCEPGFITDPYGYKPKLLDKVWWNFPMPDLGRSVQRLAIVRRSQTSRRHLHISCFTSQRMPKMDNNNMKTGVTAPYART